MAFVSRSAFAREETHKSFVPGATCAECGRHSHAMGANSETGSWRFRTVTDGGSSYEDHRTFCTMACRKAYNS